MEYMIKLLTVFGLGAVELWVAIPTGIALQLHPLETGITATTGAILGMLIVIILGERIRIKLLNQNGKIEDKKHGRIYHIWARYGVAGVGLLAPLLVGAPLGAAIGITLGEPINRLVLWMSIGIVLWGIILTFAGSLGVVGIEVLIHRFELYYLQC